MPLSNVLGAQSIIRAGVCTSSTRPASPFEGQLIYETDTDLVLAWNGSSWRAVSDTSATNGGILQIVSTTKTDTFSSTSTTYTDITGLSVSITPSAASSKVLVLANINHSLSGDNASYFQLVRDSTAIFIGDVRGSRQQVTFANLPGQYSPVQMMTASPIYLDSPNTTSATTYKFQAKVNSASYTLRINADGLDTDNTVRITSASSITALEISA